ncbi:helix-turn-helix domain-containing protein [Microbacterium sp. PI-1]|uniref:Helix-turn-helix domain-containing protein n=1 Tax=Microbacterium aurugineum TaxID=2851642 RepID=A0ABY4J6C7_9MICO|nr:helix-turn-helix domain-containing protein [Microbacterium sp. PI-1]UPL19468.1 helix-turn-helix domain-containing protein [Microbacterium aurugineum]
MVSRVKTAAEEFNEAVGRQMRAEIAASRSSIAAMARGIGIARSALDNYVTGKRAIPVPVVYSVCATLGVDPHVLLARAEERLRADGEPTARITPLRRTPDVTGPREDSREVAFESRVRHDADSDDLYD